MAEGGGACRRRADSQGPSPGEGQGQVPLQEEYSTVLRVLFDLGLVGIGEIDGDLARYACLPKVGHFWPMKLGYDRVRPWKGRREREAVFECYFEGEQSRFEGPQTSVSTALPGCMHDIG